MNIQAMKSLQGGGGSSLPPAGMYQGYLSRIIDMGERISSYQGKESKSYKIRFWFEIPNGDGDDYYTITSNATLSVGKRSNMRPFLIGLGLKEADLKKLTEDPEAVFSSLVGMTADIAVKPHVKQDGTESVKLGDVIGRKMDLPDPNQEQFFLSIDTPFVSAASEEEKEIGKEMRRLFCLQNQWEQKDQLENNLTLHEFYAEANLAVPTWEQWCEITGQEDYSQNSGSVNAGLSPQAQTYQKPQAYKPAQTSSSSSFVMNDDVPF